MSMLGISFSFGAKDSGMAAGLSGANLGLETIQKSIISIGKTAKKIAGTANMNTFFNGLSAMKLGKVASGVNTTLSATGEITSNLESTFTSMNKEVRPMVASFGLVGKEASRARSKITGMAYGMNVSATQVASAWGALKTGGKDVTKTFKKMGIGLKDLTKLEAGAGIEAKSLVMAGASMKKSWGMSDKTVQNVFDTTAKMAQSSGMGSQALKNLATDLDMLTEVYAKSGENLTGEDISKITLGIQRLGGVIMKSLGDDAPTAGAKATEAFKKMASAAVDHKLMLSGLADSYGDIFDKLLVGSEYTSVMDVFKEKDATKQLTMFMKMEKGLTKGTAAYDHFLVALDKISPTYRYLVTNTKGTTKALAEMEKAGENSSGALKKWGKEAFTSGLTAAEGMERARQGMIQSFRNIASSAKNDFVDLQIKAYGKVGKAVTKLSSDKTWGPLVKRFSLVSQVGVAGFFMPMHKGLDQLNKDFKDTGDKNALEKGMAKLNTRASDVSKALGKGGILGRLEALKVGGIATLFVTSSKGNMLGQLDDADSKMGKWVAKLGVVTGVLGGVGKAIMPLMVALPGLSMAFGSLGSSIKGLGKVVLGPFGPLKWVVLAGVAIYGIYKLINASSVKLDKHGKKILDKDGKTIDTFAGKLKKGIGKAVEVVKKVAKGIGKAFGVIGDMIKNIDWNKTFKEMGKVLSEASKFLLPIVKKVVSGIFSAFLGIGKGIIKILGKVNWSKVFNGIITGIKGALSSIGKELNKVPFAKMFNKMIDKMSSILKKLIPKIVALSKWLINGMTTALEKLTKIDWKKLFSTVVAGIKGGLQIAIHAIKKFGGLAVKAMLGSLKAIGNMDVKFIKGSISDNLIKPIDDGIKDVITYLSSDAFDNFADEFSKSFIKAIDTGGDLIIESLDFLAWAMDATADLAHSVAVAIQKIDWVGVGKALGRFLIKGIKWFLKKGLPASIKLFRALIILLGSVILAALKVLGGMIAEIGVWLFKGIKKGFKWLRRRLEMFGEWIGEMFSDLGDAFSTEFKKLGTAVADFASYIWDGIVDGLAWVGSKISGIASRVWKLIKGYFQVWVEFFEWIGNSIYKLGKYLWDGIVGGLKWVHKKLQGIGKLIGDAIRTFFEFWVNAFKWLGKKILGLGIYLWNGVKGAFTWLGTKIATMGEWVKGLFSTVWDAIVDAFSLGWTKIKEGVNYIYEGMKGLLDFLFVKPFKFVKKGIIAGASAFVGFFKTYLINPIQDAFMVMKDFLQNYIVTPISDMFSAIGKFIMKWFVKPVKDAIDWLMKSLQDITDKAVNLGKKVKDFFTGGGVKARVEFILKIMNEKIARRLISKLQPRGMRAPLSDKIKAFGEDRNRGKVYRDFKWKGEAVPERFKKDINAYIVRYIEKKKQLFPEKIKVPKITIGKTPPTKGVVPKKRGKVKEWKETNSTVVNSLGYIHREPKPASKITPKPASKPVVVPVSKQTINNDQSKKLIINKGKSIQVDNSGKVASTKYDQQILRALQEGNDLSRQSLKQNKGRAGILSINNYG